MKIEEEVFRTFFPDESKLLAYGFVREGDRLVYRKDFFGEAFTAVITVRENAVAGKAIEKELGEEFVPLHVTSYQGGYAADVREAYRALLAEIRDACFTRARFVSAQANRLAAWVYERFGEDVDYPFDEEPYKITGVFRCAENRKWYGIVMNVARRVLKDTDSEEKIDVLNVKIDETKREELLRTRGVYPSYHMNKQKWISVVLDESLPDDFIQTLISSSRSLIVRDKRKKGRQ